MSFAKSVLLGLFALTVAHHTALASAAVISNDNSFVALETQRDTQPNTQPNTQSREQIRYILEMERDVRTVDEAIRLKTQGLRYVESLMDFDYLCTLVIPNPSMAYREAVGAFIETHVGRYAYSYQDLQTLRMLEGKTYLVTQSMAVKREALRVAEGIHDFAYLVPPAVANPSDAYKQAIGQFVADHIYRMVDARSPIHMIVQVEGYTYLVSQSMAVKNAGLVAVYTQRQLHELAQYAFANPSEAYRQAVYRFVMENIDRYP